MKKFIATVTWNESREGKIVSIYQFHFYQVSKDAVKCEPRTNEGDLLQEKDLSLAMRAFIKADIEYYEMQLK